MANVTVDSEMPTNTAFEIVGGPSIASPQTFAFNNAGGTVLLLGVGLGLTTNAGSSTAFGTVSYGGFAMTKFVEKTTGTNNESRLAIYYLLNPPTGSNTVSIAFTFVNASALSISLWGGAISFVNNDTATPLLNSNTNSSNSAITLTVATPSAVPTTSQTFAVFGQGSGSVGTVTQTLSFTKNDPNTQLGSGRGTRAVGTGATVTHGHSWTGADSCAAAIVEIAAGSGGVICPRSIPVIYLRRNL